VLAVGGELVDISRTPGNGQVYDVNSYALAAAARDAGAEVNRVGIVSGDARELGEVVEGQVNRAEILVIAGAVGGAAAESVRSVLSKLGEMEVTRVAMHPGSVQGFGQLGRDGVPTFLLPANPVSALVCFELFVRPALRRLAGHADPGPFLVRAVLAEDFAYRTDRPTYHPAAAIRFGPNGAPLAALRADLRTAAVLLTSRS